jgi:hypothetical protein
MNAQIYSLLLALCPCDLQREFGAEMTEVFLEDLEESQKRSGLRGAARVWRQSLIELCALALHDAIAQQKFAVPVIMYALQLSWFGLGFLLHPEIPLPPSVLLGLPVLLVPSAIAFLAVAVAHRNAPILLQLERR